MTGFPRKLNDLVEKRHSRPIKLFYTEHAERNAIYAAARNGVRLLGSTMYVTGGGTPCADCTRAIIQAGISKVVCMDKKFEGKSSVWAESCSIGEEMLLETGVELILLAENYRVARTVQLNLSKSTDQVRKLLRPMFMETIMFGHATEEQVEKIIDNMLNNKVNAN